MNAAIRRLALDVSPWYLAFYFWMYATGVFMNILWLNRPLGPLAPLMVGFFFNISAAQSMQKVAIWRTLPVSHRQIDLARWCQGIAFPFVSLALIMILPALAMQNEATLHARWPQIFLMLAAQFGCSAIVFAAFVASPFLASPGGRVFFRLVAVLPIALAPLWLRNVSALAPILAAIASLGFLLAVILFASAGRWPLPITGWAALLSGRPVRKNATRPGLSGWPALVLAQMPLVLLCWAAILVLPLLLRSVFGIRGDVSVTTNIALLGAGLLTALSFATAMRALRALPLTGVGLALRLVATLLAIQLVGAALFAGTITWFEPDHPPLAALALLPAALPVLVFALALRFGPVVGQFAVAISIVSANLGAFLLWQMHASLAAIVALVLLLTGLGSLLAHREIVSGRHAYRNQPLLPMSWRGR